MSPLITTALFLPLLCFAALAGVYFRHKHEILKDVREDLGVILAAALTLLGLVIGFTFSMAVNRYESRIQHELDEANAISSAVLRTSLLPAADAARLHDLLVNYARQRLSFYSARDARHAEQVNITSVRLQTEIWSSVQLSARAQPTPITALAVSAVNDAFGAQMNAQAAWEDRLPSPAWMLIGEIAVFSNLLLGYTSRPVEYRELRLLILPVLVSCSLALIADLGNPYAGVIQTAPRDLLRIVNSLS